MRPTRLEKKLFSGSEIYAIWMVIFRQLEAANDAASFGEKQGTHRVIRYIHHFRKSIHLVVQGSKSHRKSDSLKHSTWLLQNLAQKQLAK